MGFFWDDEQLIKRFFDKVEKKDSCWDWKSYYDKDNYGLFKINGTMKRAHRISFEIYNKRQIIIGMCILHSCDNPKCVNPLHLSEGTHQDNTNDKIQKNRQARNKGELSGTSKLKSEQVLKIREKYATREYTQQQLAMEYNISRAQIYFIVHQKRWAHI